MKAFLSGGIGRRLLLALGMAAYLGVAVFVLERTGIGCVFRYFLGIPCPGCGLTRALRALLRLDIVGAFRYNPLIFAMPYVFVYILFPLRGKGHKWLLSGIGIVALLNWAIRILCVAI